MSNVISSAIETSIAARIANAVPNPDRLMAARNIALHYSTEQTPYLKHIESDCKQCRNAPIQTRTIHDRQVEHQLCSIGWALYEDHAYRQTILNRMMGS